MAIERPDASRSMAGQPMQCRVMSARTQAGGLRAIAVRVPYEMVADKFRAEDGDSVYHYAELIGDHLQIHERASQREFFIHPEQSSPAH